MGFLVLQFAVTLGAVESGPAAQHWVYVACYLLTAAYAAWRRAWLPAWTAVMVAVLRAMVAEGATGAWFQLASAAFAGLFFLLCVTDAEARHFGRSLPPRERRRQEMPEVLRAPGSRQLAVLFIVVVAIIVLAQWHENRGLRSCEAKLTGAMAGFIASDVTLRQNGIGLSNEVVLSNADLLKLPVSEAFPEFLTQSSDRSSRSAIASATAIADWKRFATTRC